MSPRNNAKTLILRSLNLLHRGAARLPAVGVFRPARGTFSALRGLRDGELEGQILHERQETGVCPPGSMTEAACFRQHDHQPWPVFWTKSDDARLVGRLQIWRDPADRICSEAVYNHPDRLSLGEDKWSAQLIVPPPEKIDGAWISLSSKWNDGGNYFHWLLDGLTRLAVREKLPEKTGILLPAQSPPFVIETIRLLGLEQDVASPVHPCLQPQRYYFCSPTAMTGVWNPLGFDWLRKAFSPHFAPPKSGPPVFLTRRASTRVPGNIGEIENLLESHGFEIVDCGAISVREQIRKISAAPAIAGLHGAAMTNLLWANCGTSVLELFQPAYLNACYEQIAFQGQQKYTAIILEGERPLAGIAEWIDCLKS